MFRPVLSILLIATLFLAACSDVVPRVEKYSPPPPPGELLAPLPASNGQGVVTQMDAIIELRVLSKTLRRQLCMWQLYYNKVIVGGSTDPIECPK